MLGTSEREEHNTAERQQCEGCTDSSNHIHDYTGDWSSAGRPSIYILLEIAMNMDV